MSAKSRLEEGTNDVEIYRHKEGRKRLSTINGFKTNKPRTRK